MTSVTSFCVFEKSDNLLNLVHTYIQCTKSLSEYRLAWPRQTRLMKHQSQANPNWTEKKRIHAKILQVLDDVVHSCQTSFRNKKMRIKNDIHFPWVPFKLVRIHIYKRQTYNEQYIVWTGLCWSVGIVSIYTLTHSHTLAHFAGSFGRWHTQSMDEIRASAQFEKFNNKWYKRCKTVNRRK